MSDTAPKSWREKLFGGLKRTSEKLGENLGVLFAKPLDAQTLDEIEEALIVSTWDQQWRCVSATGLRTRATAARSQRNMSAR
jgi:hypothetical protein